MVSGFSALCSDVQFPFFSVRANFLQHQISCCQHDRVDLPGRLGTDGHTPHAGDTKVLIRILGILGINGTYRALLGTKPAVVARLVGLGHHSRTAGLLIRPVAGNGGLCIISGSKFLPDLGRKRLKLLFIFRIRPSGGITAVKTINSYSYESFGYWRRWP